MSTALSLAVWLGLRRQVSLVDSEFTFLPPGQSYSRSIDLLDSCNGLLLRRIVSQQPKLPFYVVCNRPQ
jgi:hypothetical protein